MKIKGADQFLDFVKKAFKAKEVSLVRQPDGRASHVIVQIGNSMVMFAESCEEGPWAEEWGAAPTTLYLYVPDVDAAYAEALAAGARSILGVGNQFYGDRSGCVKDAWGNKWCIATRIEDLSDREIENRRGA
jgi:PhnB protein